MAVRWRALALLFLARFMMAFQFQSVAAIAPLVEAHYGMSLADVGILIGIYFAPGVVIAFPGGAVAARFGDRRLVALGLALMIGGGALALFAPSYPELAAGRLIAGVGGIIINVVMTKMATDWFAGHEIATAMAIYINSWPVGIGAALVILPPVAGAAGITIAWGAMTLAIALALFAFLALYPSPQRGAAGGPDLRLSGIPFAPVLAAGLIWALFNAALAMVFSFGPALLHDRGWTLATASFATSLYIFVVAIAVPLGGVLADRSGKRDTIIAASLSGFAVLLVALVYLPLAAVPAAFVAMGVISGLGGGPIVSLPSQVLRPEVRAAGMGLFYTIYYATVFVAPALAGWLADRTASIASTFLFGALMLAICLPTLAKFRSMARIQAASEAD